MELSVGGKGRNNAESVMGTYIERDSETSKERRETKRERQREIERALPGRKGQK